MLHEFLRANGAELIDRCRRKAANRRVPDEPLALEHGVPRFIEQLAEMLDEASARREDVRPSPPDPASPAESRIRESAKLHGRELLRHHYTIEQVVHDYGDLCQAITEMAFEKEVRITVQEFGVLNIRLDNAIAGAVTEYAHQLEATRVEGAVSASRLAHEMGNLLNTAILAVSAIKGGTVGLGGATAAALERSLASAKGLAERAVIEFDADLEADVRHLRATQCAPTNR